jgi:hypothetical protein
MPELCKYRMCHRVASSTYSGYCNEVHYERGKLDELKEAYEEQLKKVKALEAKAHSTSYETGSELK